MQDDIADSSPRPHRRPRKASAASLENVALHYLGRFAATTADLRRVLMNRVRRSARVHGTDPAEGAQWVEAVIAKCLRLGLVDDRAYARARAASLRAGGLSRRGVLARLAAKGIDRDSAAVALAEADLDAAAGASAETAADPDLAAATAWARRHRLGPFGRPELRAARRQKDLASLGRAGFPYAVAKAVIDGDGDDGTGSDHGSA